MCGQVKKVVNLLFWGKAQEHSTRQGLHHCDLFRGGWSALHVSEVFLWVFAESYDLGPFLISHVVASVKGACAKTWGPMASTIAHCGTRM